MSNLSGSIEKPDIKIKVTKIAWPSIVLSYCTILLYLYTTSVELNGFLSVVQCTILYFISGYLAFTVLHESVHNNLYRVPAVNSSTYQILLLKTIPGYFAGFILMIEPSVFKYCHLLHHAQTNNPDVDPDMWSCGPEGSKRFPFSWMSQGFYYYFYYLKNTRKPKNYFKVFTFIMCLFFFVRYYLGIWQFALWFLTHRVVEMVLVLVLSYIPHHPHNETPQINKFRATNRVNLTILDIPLLYQTYHIIHHLYTYIPWYEYKPIYFELQEYLVNHGTKELVVTDIIDSLDTRGILASISLDGIIDLAKYEELIRTHVEKLLSESTNKRGTMYRKTE